MNLLKSEWIKVTTTKSAYWLYAIGIALAVLLAVIIGQFDQSATDPIAGEAGGGSDPLFAILGVSAFTVLLVWIAAIVGVTGEYRYHTAKATYLTTPSRWPAAATRKPSLVPSPGPTVSRCSSGRFGPANPWCVCARRR